MREQFSLVSQDNDGNGAQPALLYALLESRSVTVGQLVDFANGIPECWVQDTVLALLQSVSNDYRAGTRRTERRRRLVILGALLTRLAFEVEGIPKSRSAKT